MKGSSLKFIFQFFIAGLFLLGTGGCGGGNSGTGGRQVEGEVRSKQTGEPLAGIRVRIEGTDRVAVTDSSGRFSFEDVEDSGSITVRLEGESFNTTFTANDIPADTETIRLELNVDEDTGDVEGNVEFDRPNGPSQGSNSSRAPPGGANNGPLPEVPNVDTDPDGPRGDDNREPGDPKLSPTPTSGSPDNGGNTNSDEPRVTPTPTTNPNPEPTVDSTPPLEPNPTLSQISLPSFLSATDVTVRGLKSAGSSVELNGNQIVNFNSSTEWESTLALNEGPNSLSFRAVLPDGRMSEPSVWTVTRDTINPGTPGAQIEDISPTSATLLVSSMEPIMANGEYRTGLAAPVPFESASFETSHRVLLTGLTPSTNYRVNLAVYDRAMNQSILLTLAFNTLAQPTAQVVGTGNFLEKQTISLPSSIVDVISGDFTSDGKLDLVAVTYMNDLDNSGNAILYERDGQGSFIEHSSFFTASRIVAAASGDFNNDGKLDFAVYNNGNVAPLFIHLNNGDGTFQTSHVSLNQPPAIATPFRLAVSDIDHDGNLDLVTGLLGCSIAECYHGMIIIQRGDGNGGFSNAAEIPLSDFTGTTTDTWVIKSINVADINQDGISEIIVGSNLQTFVISIRNDFTSGLLSTLPFSPQVTTGINVRDFNGDGHPDILCEKDVYVGTGDGQFSSGFINEELFTSVDGFDLNKDGYFDLVGFNAISQLVVQFGNANHDPQNVSNSRFNFPILATKLVELNGDGIPDILAFGTEPTGITTVGILHAETAVRAR